jgi:hypothetical protein
VAAVLVQQVMALLAHLALIQFFQLLPHLVVVRVDTMQGLQVELDLLEVQVVVATLKQGRKRVVHLAQ